MCMGGGGTRTVVQKAADPMPTTVAVSSLNGDETSAEATANKKQRRKRGIEANYTANDRTILGGEVDENSAKRTTLG